MSESAQTPSTPAPPEPLRDGQEVDVIIVGSGAAAFSAAIGAAESGLSVLMLEAAEKWGGSTAMSGGGMWLPDNPLMRRDRVADSREEALDYLERTVGDEGPATSRARKEAFVDGVADLVGTLERHGIELVRAKDYPDYYPELPGGKVGRALEVRPFDAKRIGEAWKSCRALIPLPMMTDDVWEIQRAWSSPGGAVRGARIIGRIAKGLVTRQTAVGIGAGLAAALYWVAVEKLGVDLRLSTPVTDLVEEGGHVVGVEATSLGRTVTLRARRGVVLGTGGFDHNKEMRLRYHGIEGNPSGAPSNLGQVHEIAERHGAAMALMDDAWWGASIAPAEGVDPGFIVGERSLPFMLIADERGERFANEAESYVDLGHHMLEHGKDQKYWLVADVRHSWRYLLSFAMDPRVMKARKANGDVVKARSLDELAAGTGMDPETLRATVERFNAIARSGIDHDFRKGDSAYDRYYGDPGHHPNPCLGTIERGPFTAYRVVIGDLGTKGGILTDADARVLREDGSVIVGLYAAGNCSASVMGRTYPGPGSTIGPAAVFGLRAARYIAATDGV